jgi:hypothetical protein
MPDENGKLTPEDLEKTSKWWADHWKEPVICPVCKGQTWQVGPHVIQINRHASNGLFGPGVSYPQILVVCTTCANTMMFNATILGLYEPFVEKPAASVPETQAAPGGEAADG